MCVRTHMDHFLRIVYSSIIPSIKVGPNIVLINERRDLVLAGNVKIIISYIFMIFPEKITVYFYGNNQERVFFHRMIIYHEFLVCKKINTLFGYFM